MGMYAYRAVNQDGVITNGHLPAISQRELDSRLQAAGLELIKARAVRQSLFFRTRIPSRELINFCLHMETTLSAGLMITDALEDQVESAGHRTFRDVMLVILQAVREGSSLSGAMQAFPDVFSEVFVGMVYSGEESGRLAQAFQKLGESLRWQDELSSQMKRMIMYPAFTVAVLIGVTAFVLIYLVPELALFIRSMSDGDLPLQTWVLLKMSELLRAFWIEIALSPFVAALVLFVFLRVGGAVARHTMDSMKLRIPVVGRVIKMIVLSRFSALLAMLYESGVPVIQAMETARDAVGNRAIASAVERAIAEIQQGKGMTESFAATGLFPNLMLRMIRIGEISGEVEKGLRNISYFYNRDIHETIGRIQAMVEPVLTLALGLLLGGLMMSVLGPIYDLLGTVGF